METTETSFIQTALLFSTSANIVRDESGQQHRKIDAETLHLSTVYEKLLSQLELR